MLSRRSFLQAVSLVLLPTRPSLACSGEETVPLLGAPLPNTAPKNIPITDFLVRYIGHSNWSMDNESLVNIDLRGTKKVGGYLLPENPQLVPLEIALSDQHDYLWAELDLLLERHLPVLSERLRNALGSNELVVRTKIAKFTFPVPGVVSAVSVPPQNFDAPGRVVAVSRLNPKSNKSSVKTIVTTSAKVRGYCVRPREIVFSYEEAVSVCDHLATRGWSHQDVAKCKNSFKYEWSENI